MRRSLIVFLLLVALPFKGWAATGMMACGPQHHRVADVHNAAGGSSGTHQHGAGSQHDHGVAGSQHEHADVSQHQHASVAQHPRTLHDSMQAGSGLDRSGNAIEITSADPRTSKVELKCGTCAPCCAGAAIAGVHPQVPAVDPVNATDFPAFLSVHPSVPLGRLDRPPRARLG